MKIKVGCFFIPFNTTKDQILISKRSSMKRTFPLMWETLGGALEANENIDECIQREISEELGCRIKWFKQYKTYSTIHNGITHILIGYIGELEGNICIRKEEIESIKWITKNEIDKFEFCPLDENKISDAFISVDKI